MRAELTNPIASPEARCAMAATESGNTGAMQSTCRKRSTPKLHTWPASDSVARSSEEPSRNHSTAPRSPRRSARRGAAIAPSEAAMPVAKIRNPPTSRVDSGATPSGGRIWGRIEVRKKIWVEPASTTSDTVTSSRSEVAPLAAAAASRGLPVGTPHDTRAEQPHSMNAPSTNERRKPTRAATSAPAAGPSTWPRVMPDWM